MSNTILFNNYDLINGQLIDWNAAFNNPDFIDYITHGSITSFYVGYERIIEDYKYSKRNYTSMTFPSVNDYIGEYAFINCKNLQGVYFTCTYTSVSTSAIIGQYAFSGCDLLSSIYCANNKKIEQYAFANLPNLRTVEIGPTTQGYGTMIGPHAFENCGSLSDCYMSGVFRISDYAFYNCSELHIDQSNSSAMRIFGDLSIVGDYAFYGCTQIKNVDIGKQIYSRKYIGSHAFERCDSLETVTISNGTMSIGDYCFYNNKKIYSVKITYSYAASSSGYLGSHAFDGCESLTYLSFSSMHPIIIGSYAFRNCPLSSYLYMSSYNNVRYIGNNAFENCAGLTYINIGSRYASTNGLSFIGTNAFRNCKNLSTVFLHGQYSFTSDMFWGCSKLFHFENDVYRMNSSAYINMMMDAAVTSDIFKSAMSTLTVYSDYFVNIISDYAFYNFTSLAVVALSNGQSTGFCIGNHAFDGCTNLTSFYITCYGGTKCLSYLGEYAFRNCPIGSLSLVFDKDAYVHSSAFSECSAHIIYIMSLYSIPEYTFKGLQNLNSAHMGYVKVIGSYAFDECINLNSVYAYEVQQIGAYAFHNCSSLSLLYFPYAISIDNHAFDGCDNLKSIQLSAISHINSAIFQSNIGLNSIIINTDSRIIKEIEPFAFANCPNLHFLSLGYVHTIPDNILYNTVSLLSFSAVVTSAARVPNYLFNSCSILNSVNILGNLIIDDDTYNMFGMQSDSFFGNISNMILGQVIFHSRYHFLPSTLQNLKMLSIAQISIDDNNENIFNNLQRLSMLTIGSLSLIDVSNYLEYNGTIKSISLAYVFYEHNGTDPYATNILKHLSALEYVNIGNIATKVNSDGQASKLISLSSDLFNSNSQLIQVSIGIGHVMSYAMANKSKLLSFKMMYQGSMTIDEYAFYNCILLSSISNTGTGNALYSYAYKYIGSHAFENCAFTGFFMSSIGSIYTCAFKNCSKLSYIGLSAVRQVPYLESIDAFDGLPDNYNIHVSNTMIENFISDPVWGLLSAHLVY